MWQRMSMKRRKLISAIGFFAAILLGGRAFWVQNGHPKPVRISYTEPGAYRGWPVIYQLQANGQKLFSPAAATYGAANMPPDGGGIIGGIVLPGKNDAPDQATDWNISWIEWQTGHAYRAEFTVVADDFPPFIPFEERADPALGRNGAVAKPVLKNTDRYFHYFIRIGKNGELTVLTPGAELQKGGLERAPREDDFVLLFKGCAERAPELEKPGASLADDLAQKLGLAYGSGPKKGELIERIADHLNDPVPDGSCHAFSSEEGN